MATIAVYNVGKLGVNVDKSPVHLEDGELTKAQNAMRDPLGLEGGLRKRLGLTKFNTVAGAGTFRGGIGVPLPLLVNLINGVSLGGGPTRTTYWGRQARAVGYGITQGWWTSTTGWTTAAAEILAGTPANPRTDSLSDGSSWGNVFTGSPGAAVVVNNRLYYAADYTDLTNPPIRVFDGTLDYELVTIPFNSALGTNYSAITSMLLVSGVIYVAVKDGTTADLGNRTGRVFALDPSSGALTLLGANFPLGYQPYALGWHMGRLWAGTMYRSVGADVAGTISWFRPNIDAVWTLDRTMSQGRGCTFLYSYKGELFAGNWTGTSGTTSVVEKRDSVGAWTVSLSVATGTDSMFMNARQFGANLYVTHFNQSASVSTIRKYTGSVWSTALTTGDTRPLSAIWVDSSVIYAGGGGDNTSANLWSSTDGTAWTSRTANLTNSTNMTGATLIGTLAVPT